MRVSSQGRNPKSLMSRTKNNIMANFNVYFKVANRSGRNLAYLSRAMGSDTSLNFGINGATINNGATGSFYLDGYGTDEGASGAVSWMTTSPVNGSQHNVYTWFGSCPIIESNSGSGPGMGPVSSGGHPLSLSVTITGTTPPSYLWPQAASKIDLRAIKAKIAGKKAVKK